MEIKLKPQYLKTTHFARTAQYLNVVIECFVFAIALVLYVNHYSLDQDIYENWNKKPILTLQLRDQCQTGEEEMLSYSFPSTSAGCYCGEDTFQPSLLQADFCTDTELKQNCKQIETLNSFPITKWKNKKLCGTRHEKTFRELNSQKVCTTKCAGICMDTCPNFYFGFTKHIYTMTINYATGICQEHNDKSNSNNYPLFDPNYDCVVQDVRFKKLEEVSQKDLLTQNGYDLTTLTGYETYQNLPNFGLYEAFFTEHTCGLPLIELVDYRDNQIQLSSLIVLIFSGILLGIGAICFAGVIANLNKEGILSRKVYLVGKRFYIPTFSNMFLYFITLIAIIVQLSFIAQIELDIKKFIDENCSDSTSDWVLNNQRNYLKNDLESYSIIILLITLLGILLEIFQLFKFPRKQKEEVPSPQFRKNPTHANKFSIVEVPEDGSEKNILRTEMLQTSMKNEQLKAYH